jgi:elongation factor 1-alpha
MGKEKQHINLVVIGHVDSGQSTTTGHLIYTCGGIDKRTIEKFEKEAAEMGKGSFKYAWVLDNLKAERERGITIDIALWKFETPKYMYTVIDAPGHRDFIKNMITGASQADVALLMVPADGNFTAAIAKGNHKAGEVQGQTRQHARLLNLLGTKQLIVGVNKMDSDVAKYSKERYDEISNEMRSMLIAVGWPKGFVNNRVPIIPISGWKGDNLIKKSENMDWWKGVEVVSAPGSKCMVHTLLDALNDMVVVPKRDLDKPLRVPISGVYKIKGVGDVITGRVEQGKVSPGDEVVFIPTHTAANACSGKVFTVEMHHKQVPFAGPGDNVGMNVKGLVKGNMPRAGDVMIMKNDSTLKQVKSIEATIQFLDIPNEVKVGYTPIGFIRTARTPLKLTKVMWRSGKDTGGNQVPDPTSIPKNNMALCQFTPMKPFTCESFEGCEGLARLALMEGNGCIGLGRVSKVEF